MSETALSAPDAPELSEARKLLRRMLGQKAFVFGVGLLLLFIAIALLAPVLAPHDPYLQNLTARNVPPFWYEKGNWAHPLGTDPLGRDYLSRLLYGARISLVIGIASTVIAMLAGSLIGILAGWYGGRFDVVVMQAMDILLAFPSLILGLILVAMLGPSMENITIAIALTSIPSFARIARAPTISVKERDYIEAGRALAFSDARIMTRHILPNIFPEILVMASLWLANAIRTEASLAFIGLGVKPPTATWGGMIREGFENILDSYWLVLAPSLAILIIVFALNILGDGLRDAIDPKLKGER